MKELTASAYSGSGKKGANVTDALFEIAAALDNIATQIKFLGNGDAATSMGAIEAFGAHIGEKLDMISDALKDDG